MKQILFVVGILMAIYSNILADTEWTTAVGDDGEYADNLDEWVKLEIPNAKNITVSVTGETEPFYDRVYIRNDDNSTKLRTFHGYIDEHFNVVGSAINLNFSSDYSVAHSGVTVSIEEVNTNLVIRTLHVEENATIDGDLQVKGEILDADGNVRSGGESPWTKTGDEINYSGNVGIGVNNPTAGLDIHSSDNPHDFVRSLNLTEGISFNRKDGHPGTIGIYPIDRNSDHSYTGGFKFLTQDNQGGGPSEISMIIRSSGNVGIGTTNPQRTLHIKDVMRLEPQSNVPSGGMGDLYAGTNGELYFHNGTDWKKIQLLP